MRPLFLGLLLAFLAWPSSPGARAQAQDRFIRSGLYVVSSDVEESTRFYEAVFNRQPIIKTQNFVGFDIVGGLFAIASRQAFAPDAPTGRNVVPYIMVSDIDAEFARIRRLVPEALESRSVIREGAVALFKFRDPDGNIVEFFARRPVD